MLCNVSISFLIFFFEKYFEYFGWIEAQINFIRNLEPLVRSPLTLWKVCDNVVNYDHSKCSVIYDSLSTFKVLTGSPFQGF